MVQELFERCEIGALEVALNFADMLGLGKTCLIRKVVTGVHCTIIGTKPRSKHCHPSNLDRRKNNGRRRIELRHLFALHIQQDR
jgi:hypothetical protein